MSNNDTSLEPSIPAVPAFPISRLAVISQNLIKGEAGDIVANTPGHVDVHLNNLLGKQTGVDSSDGATVNATENWWGCSGGSGANGCASVSGSVVLSAPWLTKPF